MLLGLHLGRATITCSVYHGGMAFSIALAFLNSGVDHPYVSAVWDGVHSSLRWYKPPVLHACCTAECNGISNKRACQNPFGIVAQTEIHFLACSADLNMKHPSLVTINFFGRKEHRQSMGNPNSVQACS